MTETLGIAVVGTGDWGANLVRNFSNLPGARLVSLCDADPQRLAKTAALHPGARAVADQLTRDLGEAEFTLPGHIVADIAVEGAMVEHPDGAISLTIEALTVED
jgi:hypothetical protein